MIKKSIFIILCTIITLPSTIIAMDDTIMTDTTEEKSPSPKREFLGILPNPCPRKSSRTAGKRSPTQTLGAEEVSVEISESTAPDVALISALHRHIEQLKATIAEKLRTLPANIADQLAEIAPKEIETPRKTAILDKFTTHSETFLREDVELLTLYLQRDEFALMNTLDLIAISKDALSKSTSFT